MSYVDSLKSIPYLEQTMTATQEETQQSEPGIRYLMYVPFQPSESITGFESNYSGRAGFTSQEPGGTIPGCIEQSGRG